MKKNFPAVVYKGGYTMSTSSMQIVLEARDYVPPPRAIHSLYLRSRKNHNDDHPTTHFDLIIDGKGKKIIWKQSSLNGCQGSWTNSDDVAPEVGLNITLSMHSMNGINIVRVIVNDEHSYWNQSNSSYLRVLLLALAIPSRNIDGCIAFLNGNNGEATNSDDVAGMSIDECLKTFEKASMGLESFTRHHVDVSRKDKARMRSNMIHKNPTPHKSKKNPPVTQKDVMVESTSVGSTEVSEACKLKIFYPRSVKPYNGVGYDGKKYFELDEEIISDITTWKVGGPGWYDPDPEGKNEGFLPLVQPIISAGYYRRLEDGKTLSIPSKTFDVILPLAKNLFEKFPAARTSPQWTDALAASVTKATCGLLESEGNDTISYVFTTIHKRDTTYVGETSLMQKYTDKGHVIGLDNNGITGNLSVLPLFNSFAPLEVEDIEIGVVEDYEVRQDFNLVHNNVALDPEGRPLFSEGRKRKTHRTLSSTFTRRFVQFSKSAINLRAGLTRLLKKRENEEIYRLNAAIIGNAMVTAGMMPSEIAQSINQFHDGIAEQQEELLQQQGISMEVPSLIARALKKVVDLNTRTTIQCWLDGINTTLTRVAHKGKWLYENMWKNMASVFYPDEARSYISKIPHLKRALRERYVKGALMSDFSDLLVQSPVGTIKMELAKPGKNPRLFVTYDNARRGTSGSVYANELPEMVKICMNGIHEFEHNGVTMEVCIVAKPEDHKLSELFTWLIDSMTTSNHIRILVYSDDSCYAGNIKGKPFCFNVDISSNDSSQSSPAFGSVFSAQHKYIPEAAVGLLAQCKLPIKVCNPENPEESCSIQFDCAFEGSGHVNTTILNNYATLTNVLGFLHVLTDNIRDSIVLGAQLGGHKVTVEDCFIDGSFIMEKLQFLKRSPFMSNGVMVSCLNMGVLLRSFGGCNSDLISVQVGIDSKSFANMSFDDRWERFNSQVVASYINEPANPILSAFRRRYTHVSERLNKPSYFEFKLETNGQSSVDEESFLARYDMTGDELALIINAIENLKLGQHFNLSGIDKILLMDYGLPFP